MAGKTAIFVDLDSVNTLYKLEDRFVAALNYNSSVNRLCETPPALGAGYDIYLCLKPRAEGEGNVVIEELSIPGLPFTVDGEELYQVLKFFRGYSGFGEVYLCNWVANYIAMARVGTFKSAVYYGDRVAYMTVSNSVLQEFRLFDNQRAFVDELGEGVDAYGDIGLLDVDGLRARYPELASASKAQLVAVAPLIQCYRTPLKMETTEYFEWLKQAHASGEFKSKPVEPPVYKEPKPIDDEGLKPSLDLPEPKPLKKKKQVRGKAPLLAMIFVAGACLCALCAGALTGVILKEPAPQNNDAYYAQVENRIEKLRALSSVYSSASQVMTTAQEALEYLRQSSISMTLLGFDYVDGNYTVSFATASNEDANSIIEYIGDKYTIASSNNLGQSDNSGTTTYQYSVMFSLI